MIFSVISFAVFPHHIGAFKRGIISSRQFSEISFAVFPHQRGVLEISVAVFPHHQDAGHFPA